MRYGALICLFLLPTLILSQENGGSVSGERKSDALVQLTRDYLRVGLPAEALLWGSTHVNTVTRKDLARKVGQPMRFSSPSPKPEELLYATYRPILADWFGHLDPLGTEEDAAFVDYGALAIQFLQRDQQVALLLPAVFSATVFNSVRSTERTRAARSLADFVLPILRKMPKGMKGGEVKLIGIVATYGVRDFLDTSDSSKGEAVCLLVEPATAERYARGDITDDEVVDSSEVFVANGSKVSKVKITFQ